MSNPESANPTWHSHATPRHYLQRWSTDGERVSTYRLLISDARVPSWWNQPLKSAGAPIRHLYTTTRNPVTPDEIERWLHAQFEQPAQRPAERLLAGQALARTEWAAIQRYVVALAYRTPADYFKYSERWTREFPALFQSTASHAKRKLRQAKREGRKLDTPLPADPKAAPPIRVDVVTDPASGRVAIRAATTSGREPWLYRLRHTLTDTITTLPELHWSVMRPYRDSHWFTTDDPVIRLAYSSEKRYHFDGGWGRTGCEILLPLSPECLLYTKVGSIGNPEIQLTRDQTLRFQALIAEHAFREIYARGRYARVPWFRKPYVDSALFQREQAAWQAWDELQRAAEESLGEGPPS